MGPSDRRVKIPSGSDMSSSDGIERLLSPRDGRNEGGNVGASD